MAELGASWESLDFKPDCTDGGRAMMGGVGGESLPPRKRLLAGLRQNGWLSSSSPSSVFPETQEFLQGMMIGQEEVVSAHDDDDAGDGEVEAVDVVGGDHRQQQQGCIGCNGVESSSNNSSRSSSSSATGLRRIKRGDVYLRLCESCSLLYNKSMFCPRCLLTYHDPSLLGDPALWLLCGCCGRSVHAECEIKQTSGTRIDASSYVCPDCVSMARQHKESEEGLNSLSGSTSSMTLFPLGCCGRNIPSVTRMTAA